MYFKAAVAFAFTFLSLSVQAVPLVNLAKRDGNNASKRYSPPYPS